MERGILARRMPAANAPMGQRASDNKAPNELTMSKESEGEHKPPLLSKFRQVSCPIQDIKRRGHWTRGHRKPQQETYQEIISDRVLNISRPARSHTQEAAAHDRWMESPKEATVSSDREASSDRQKLLRECVSGRGRALLTERRGCEETEGCFFFYIAKHQISDPLKGSNPPDLHKVLDLTNQKTGHPFSVTVAIGFRVKVDGT